MSSKTVEQLSKVIMACQDALNEEIEKKIIEGDYEQMVEDSPADLSARYWLMEFLKPLNRSELQAVVNGFLVPLLNEDQAKKLVKFLLVRFPGYYKEDVQETQSQEEKPCPTVVEKQSTEINI